MQARRLSNEAAAVLKLFVDDPQRTTFGREIIKETGIASGSLYPILHRFEERGYVVSEWESMVSADKYGRRPRRIYRLNAGGTGEEEALAALKDHRARVQSSARPSVRPGPATA